MGAVDTADAPHVRSGIIIYVISGGPGGATGKSRARLTRFVKIYVVLVSSFAVHASAKSVIVIVLATSSSSLQAGFAASMAGR